MNTEEGRSRKRSSAKNAALPNGYVPPTRTETQKSAEKFYELIDYYRTKRRLTWAQLADPLGVDPSTAHRKILDRKLDDDQREIVLDYLFSRSPIAVDPSGADLHQIPDALYFAFLDFCQISLTTQHTAAAECVGTYQFWRRSVEEASHYVHGRIDIRLDERSNALRVSMYQPRKPRDGLRQLTERATGYFFPVARIYALMLRDPSNSDLRITLFPHFRKEFVGTDHEPDSVYAGSINHLVHMDAFVMGLDGRDFFFSPAYVELVDEKQKIDTLDSELGIIPESKVPASVLAKLARYPFVQK